MINNSYTDLKMNANLNKKNILIVIEFKAQFKEIFYLAQLLENSLLKDHYSIKVIFFGEDLYEDEFNLCDFEKIAYIHISNRNNKFKYLTIIIGKISHILLKISILSSFVTAYNYFMNFRFYFLYKKYKKQAIQILQEYKPALLFVADQSPGCISDFFIQVSKIKYNTKTICYPYSWSSILEDSTALKNFKIYRANYFLNFFISKYFKEWMFILDNKEKILKLTAPQIISLKFLKMYHEKPWVNNYSCDYIVTESSKMLKSYISDGIPKEKCILTGKVTFDLIHKFNRFSSFEKETFYRKYNLDFNKKLTLCALPPDQSGNNIPNCEFKNYKDLLIFWIKYLKSYNEFNLVFSLHPRIPKKYIQILEEFECIYIKEDINLVIYLCDIYISSLSATIRTAVSCAKPVIYYDVYQYKMQDYFSAGGIISVNSKDNFIKIYKKLITDNYFYESLVAEQLRCSKDWGVIDGYASQRILDLIKRFI